MRPLTLAFACLFTGAAGPCLAAADDDLRTVAETTDFRATSKYADVMNLCKKLAAASKGIVQLSKLGTTNEGRSIPLLIVSDPPVKTPEEAKKSGKLVAFIIANIHAGEVCGKEAMPMLVREIIERPDHPLLKDLVLLIAPIYNADGNEKFAATNRPGQVGPEEMGERENAQGLDLNRDFVKLEAPETRAFVRLLNAWDPHLFLDLHTTNGSYHRYVITYQGPKNPAGDPAVLAFARDKLMPGAGELLEKATGFKSFFYGNFDRGHTLWTTYGATPRFGTTYVGLRDRLAVLSEAYSYADFKSRVIGTEEFTRGVLEYAAAHKDEIVKILAAAREGQHGDTVPIRSEAKVAKDKVTILGFVEEGRGVTPKEPMEYEVGFEQEFAPTFSVKRPGAYLVPPEYPEAIATLRRHGLDVEELREDLTIVAEAYTVDAMDKAARPFEGHHLDDLKVTARPVTTMARAGSAVVKATGPLGNLAVYLLEPASDDGLATWNFFDDGLEVGKDFPVLRLAAADSLPTAAFRPLPEDLPKKKPITFDSRPGGGGGRRGGGAGPVRWLDGTHWLQARGGKVVKVEAVSGKTEPYIDSGPMAKALAALPGIGESTAENLASRAIASPSGDNAGALIPHANDLYYATFDGSKAVRLTTSPDAEEEDASLSPDESFVAFVKDNDLWASSTADGKERRLTTGGTETLRHGKADWVYYEEIFNRRWRAYWWAPDSSALAFFETDDSPVKTHVILNDGGDDRDVERQAYPRSGAPNPHVRLGIVKPSGGDPVYVDPPGYPADSTLISEVGWFDGKRAYCYVQDRTQTFLDVVEVAADGHKVARLFRDTTKAWVESPGPIRVLKDGSFLFLSERDGWKHLYHYAADSSTCRQVTSGEWEISAVHLIGPDEKYAYITASKDDPIAPNAYRVTLADGTVERLTRAKGSHSVNFAPTGTMFVDTWSDIATAPQTALFIADGSPVRTLDPGSSRVQDEYEFGSRELVKIPARDGFLLEAELILPPGLDPNSTEPHPAWFQTYGGPHAPTVSDAWNGGRTFEQALAGEGFISFRMDPRSASGKGAVSTWTAYKRLGVQELEDIADAIAWLKKKTYVDGARIGMSGHSYGGFMTAYAMTHSDLFAAGIAGAPVTDWHDYDSIYTERYMLTPQENPKGYAETSAVTAARRLHGRLLIAHGAMDDNVSLRNTLHFVQALQAANEDFELMIYPSSRHGIMSGHYSRLQIEFIRRLLNKPKDDAKTPASSSAAR